MLPGKIIYIPPQLNIHPETGRHVEKLCQPQSGAGSDPPAPMDSVVDTLIGNVNGIGFTTVRQPSFIKSEDYGSKESNDQTHWWQSIVAELPSSAAL